MSHLLSQDWHDLRLVQLRNPYELARQLRSGHSLWHCAHKGLALWAPGLGIIPVDGLSF